MRSCEGKSFLAKGNLVQNGDEYAYQYVADDLEGHVNPTNLIPQLDGLYIEAENALGEGVLLKYEPAVISEPKKGAVTEVAELGPDKLLEHSLRPVLVKR